MFIYAYLGILLLNILNDVKFLLIIWIIFSQLQHNEIQKKCSYLGMQQALFHVTFSAISRQMSPIGNVDLWMKTVHLWWFVKTDEINNFF